MNYFMDVVMPKTFFSKILERLKDKGENCFAVCITKVVNGWHFLKSKVTNALNWSSSSDDEDQRYVQELFNLVNFQYLIIFEPDFFTLGNARLGSIL